MIRLVYSNRTEALLAALVADLRGFRQSAGPFEVARVVVPNRSIETYLRFGIARADGFAGNIQSLYLSRLVPELFRESRIRLLDRESLTGFLLSVLLDEEFLDARDLAPVREYLLAAGHEARVIDLRRFQLATRLSQLFEEYALSRADVLVRWRSGPAFGDTSAAGIERWERALWLRILEVASERRRRSGTEWIPLPAVIDRIRTGRVALPRRLHFFGLSYVAPFFHSLIDELSRRAEVFVYTPNPCREFWEDVASKAAAEALDDVSGLETPALRLWGRPGRENIKALNEIAENSEEAFEDPGGSPRTLLQQLQFDVLHRTPEKDRMDLRDGFSFESDRTLRVLAGPSIRREAEGIADEIWSLVRADPTLRFNDIAVIVSTKDSDAYFTHLAAAFRESHDLPHNVVGLSFAANSPVAEAIQLLLELPHSRFTRSDLLRVATHPVIAARFPEAATEEWITWCDRLGILHGADHDDHQRTYIDKDILNWDQGLRRLALGVFLPGPRSGVHQAIEIDGDRYLPEEVSQSDQPQAAQIGMLVRSLMADARFARGATLDLEDWGSFFHTLVQTYVTTTSEADDRDVQRCVSALQDAFLLDVDDRKVGFTTAQALALAALQGLSGGRGQHLAGGVVLSTAQPMRAVPFRVIFLAGLGEGKFPAPDQPDQLDLRQVARRSGDVTPRERDRYLFLEALLSARDRLVLSYVARNPLTGDNLQPSPIVLELLDIIERGYLKEAQRHLVERLPLRRSERPGVLPEAHREAAAIALRDDWRAHFSTARIPSGEDLLERVVPGKRDALALTLGMAAVPHPPAALDESPLRLSLSHLRSFLECPLQGYAKAVLRMRTDREEDLIDVEDEPFETKGLLSTILLPELCLDALASSAEGDFAKRVAAVFDARVEREVLSGRMPSGVFGQVERAAQLEQISGWARTITQEIAPDGHLVTRVFRFGGADEFAHVDNPRPPLSIDVEYRAHDGTRRQRPVQLVGSTCTIVERRPGSLLLQRSDTSSGASRQGKDHKRWLRAFLDHLVLSATGEAPEGRAHEALLLRPDEPSFAMFAGIAKSVALQYLSALASDLLSGPHDYLLPFEAVMEVRHKKKGVSYGAAVEDIFDNEFSERSTATYYGPIEDYERLRAPDEADATSMVARRFGLFFELLQIPAKSKKAA